MTFVVFLGSLFTTFCGGSAGKEGSAISMGGTLGDFIGRKFNLSDDEERTLVICGVGSAFGVIYDVPFAGAILGMELILKGRFHYSALIPAFFTTVVSNEIAIRVGSKAIQYPNLILDNSSKVYNKVTKNPYIKAILGGVITIILFFLVGDNYNGLGQSFINESFNNYVSIMDPILKILFTAVALGSVFQGGRGHPTFFVGATLGSFVAKYINLPLPSVTSLGMIGVFCSATSLPMTSITIALEYFGGEEMVAIILVMTISYIISGFYDILYKRKLPKEKAMLFEGYVHKNKE